MRQRRLQLIQSLFDEYIEMYAARDDKLTARFSNTFSGYAGSSDILVTSKDEWVKITRQDFAQVPERIHIEVLDLSLQDLAEDIIVITAFFHIHLPIPDSILSQETARLVLIFRQESNDWKIVHSGISIPYGLAKQGEIYPMTSLEERNRELESIIQARTYELAEANNRLEKLSNTDGLTNIGNRRLFDQMLQKEWSRGQRNNTPLSLIMLDIDHFKLFNDFYGHLAGDDCLKMLANSLSQSGRRAGELVTRYGGEEFVILLPNTDHQSALDTAKHVHQLIQSLAIPHIKTDIGIVTVSVGVACLLPSDKHNALELVHQADTALYLAKSAGRNCIRSVHEPEI
ncbi:diguanylate cyclase [Shewanella xiamenensis]|uniref:diguanylate cyclase n=1 Tax=Shewanella TaxID=22 RepID=UPI001CC47FEF|nr:MULTISPECIES: diguanylate cyclase [Shewanella]MCT8860393.1 diguanylate cyclase [Shewanella xiamenensis]MDN5499206.1 diguanylate cyclase [Shewanella sp.]MDN5527415.1 diguanylate cyclase [Shewanella sp.]UWG64382.1 diguanylate cyclase [Shewanella xiamenensis]BDA58870.1 diguanylate cyclase [Shewanella xiamenensis]